METRGRKKGDIVRNWLDAYDWLIDQELEKYFNNISFTAKSLCQQLKNTEGKIVNYATVRPQISRWLKRRERIRELAAIYGIEDCDFLMMVEKVIEKKASENRSKGQIKHD